MSRKLFALTLSACCIFLVNMTVFGADLATPSAAPELLTLEKSLELAFKNSKQLQMAKKEVEIAKAGLIQATGNLWPTIGYSYTKTDSELIEKSTASLSATLNLYTGGSTSRGIIIAKLKLDSALQAERKAKQQLVYEVKENYFQLWVAEQKLKVAKDSYDNLGRHYQREKQFYDVGNSSKFDLLQAQVEWQKLKPQVIQAEHGVALRKLGFAILIGLPKEQQFTVSYEPSKLQLEESTDIMDLSNIFAEANRNNPDMINAKIAKEIANQYLQIAYSGYKPKISISHSYMGEENNELNPFAVDKKWAMIANLSGVIFDGFATQARVSSAKDEKEKTAIGEIQVKDKLELDLEQALQGLKESIEIIRSNELNTNLAKESLRLTQARFDAGMNTTMDLADSQLRLDQALNGYYDGILKYLTAQAKLDLVLGKDTFKE